MNTPVIPWAVLARFVHDLDAALDRAQREANHDLRELATRWTLAQEDLVRQARGVADTARVRAHLAAADARDAAHDLRERLRVAERRLHAVKVRAEGDASAALDTLGHACLQLSERLGARPASRDAGPVDDGDPCDFDGRDAP